MTPVFSANLGFLWKDLPPAERIRRAAANGFAAVEFHDEAQRHDAAAIRAALGGSGLELVCLNTAMAGTMGCAAIAGRQDEARRAIAEAVATAGRLGGRAVHVTAGICKAGPEAHRLFVSNLDYACTLAAASGLTILIEPISERAVAGYFLSRLEQAAAVVTELARPNLRLMFDCFHIDAMGHDLAAAFAAHAGMIGHVQIAGIPGRDEPDRGRVDYTRLIPQFIAAGYSGAFGCEYRPMAGVEEGLGWMAAFR